MFVNSAHGIGKIVEKFHISLTRLELHFAITEQTLLIICWVTKYNTHWIEKEPARTGSSKEPGSGRAGSEANGKARHAHLHARHRRYCFQTFLLFLVFFTCLLFLLSDAALVLLYPPNFQLNIQCIHYIFKHM